jgi:hypothetical protein
MNETMKTGIHQHHQYQLGLGCVTFFCFKTLSGKSGPIENSWKTKTVHMIVFQPCASKIVGISVEQQLIAESFSQPSSSRTKTTAFETKFSSIKKRWFLETGDIKIIQNVLLESGKKLV